MARRLVNVGRALGRLEAVNPAWWGLAVGLVAVIYRVVVGIDHAGDTFGHLIKGVPVSDARRWHSMAEDFARGQPADPHIWWDGVRPLYWMFLGSVFALTGPSLVAAWLANVVLGAVAAVLMFEIVRRLASPALGTVAGLALALDFDNARFALSPTTEPLGSFLALVAVFFLVSGTAAAARDTPEARRSASLAFLAGGAALGLSNLARPLSLIAASTLPFAVALVLRRRPVALPFRRLAVLAAVFLAGVVATVGPWMVRQRVKHGVWSISVNSAEMAYAAVTRRYGVWTPQVGALGDRFTTIRDRVEFFDREAWRNLRADPGFFVGRTARDLIRVTYHTRPERWPLVAACAAWLALALARGGGRRVAAVLAAGALAALVAVAPDGAVASLWVAATLVACVTRHSMAIPGVLLATTVLTMAAISAPYDARLYLQGQAFALMLSVWLVWRVLALASRDAGAGADEPRGWGRAGRVVSAVAIAAAAVVLLGAGKALLTHADAAPPRALSLGRDEAAPWIAAVLEREPEYAPVAGKLEVRRARVRREYRMPFGAWERLDHWNPLFATPRPYAFTVFETRPAILGPQERLTDAAPAYAKLYAVFPGPLAVLPSDELLFIGVPVQRTLEGSSFEVVAIGRQADGPSRLVLAPAPARAQHARMLAR